ncbi:hypothetical protein BVRB_006540 isoform B [Beta vulgaris subsp. vulgaris]|uniref:Uncharacterized protein n=2 Tax=Beta vulgaris subsp. vulgaris TaxID=3555 RepID=A0A0J8B3C3_BETVV|nr:hypothetical protein BVRB_006540 isoform B [Beta vulgaris subsp. vulgaris]
MIGLMLGEGDRNYQERISGTINLLAKLVPDELRNLMNFKMFRINDNNFDGVIPDYIKDWEQLNRLEIHASAPPIFYVF